MYFYKFPYPSNFDFVSRYRKGTAMMGKRKFAVDISEYDGDIFRVTLRNEGLWPRNYSQAGLTPPRRRKASRSGCSLDYDAGFGLRLSGPDGRILLAGPSGHGFGMCGKASIFMFEHEADYQFYGMGEKCKPLELSNVVTKFWNTDAVGEFHMQRIMNEYPDPLYVSIPYLVIKRGNEYVGLLLDNPHATFMSTRPVTRIGGCDAVEGHSGKGCFWIGSESGMPDLYVIVGPSLPELTRKLQMLVGPTPLPPAWALGYHQCRWGYESLDDMEYLDANFRRFRIPCDAFWFDIEYMDGYRVFTWDQDKFPERAKAFKDLAKRGRRIVPILDPGVKFDPGYEVYDDGCRNDIYCKTPDGRDFIGIVWPGETVFPDFSTRKGRAWWSKWVKRFADTGVSGAWLDMNDPSIGNVDVEHMLFNRGTESHDTFHNQYALGMARASREGFLMSNPDRRPFMLCRSGSTGSGKYTAIWTGDNYSNWHNLRSSIAMTLNLALSGIPFNGTDVGGFAGDVSQALMIKWVKAAFLFPVMRNHSGRGCMHQEPWIFDNEAIDAMREYIRLRYKFRPYLYNLFVAQEESGEAILRPLFYDFADTAELPLGTVGDQFMCGPALMHAPVVGPEDSRSVVLPGSHWYSMKDAAWISGGRTIVMTGIGRNMTPLFARDGGIVPAVPGDIGDDSAYNGAAVEFHIFLAPDGIGTARAEYVFDDGESFGYRRGERSRFEVRAEYKGGNLEVSTRLVKDGYGKCAPAFVFYGTASRVKLNGRPVKFRAGRTRIAGVSHAVILF